MNKEDRNKVLAGSDSYLSVEEGEHIIKRVLAHHGKVPIAFIDALDDGPDVQIALGTREGYRGKGYGSQVAKECIDWVKDSNKYLKKNQIVWGVRVDNAGSIAIAKKNGFSLDPDSYSDDKTWVNYVLKLKN